MGEQAKERAEGANPADVPAGDAKRINMNNAQNAVDAMGNFLEQNFGIEGFSDFAEEHPFVGTVLSLLNVGMHLGGGDLTTILSTTVNKPRKNPEETDEDGDDDPLTKTINEITAKYTSQIEKETTDSKKKELITQMFTEIFQELKKQSETTTVFETYVEQKIEQKKQLDKKENENLTDEEEKQCITDAFEELIDGVERDIQLYMKLNLEKIKYECEHSEDVKVVDVLQKIAEEFPDSKKYAVNNDNINDIKNNEKVDINKGNDFRNAMLKSGMVKMLFETIDVEISEDQIKKYCEAQRKFEEELCDSLGKLNNPTDADKKDCIKTCYQTLKTNILNLNRESDDKDTIEGIMQDYMKNKGGVFAEIVNEDNAPSEATE